MLRLSKLDQTQILIPVESIKYIEKTPDTVIFFLNGDSVIVREGLEEVRARVVEFRREILNKKE